MPNIFDRYYKEAKSKFPQELIPNQNIPTPDYPRHISINIAEIYGDNDLVRPVSEVWNYEASNARFGNLGDFQTISKDQREILDRGVQELGLEVYAFYKSFRHAELHPYKGKWGIFYLECGLNHISKLIEEVYPASCESPIRSAYEFLREHERFHFKFDLYALSVEANIGRALYIPLKLAFRHHQIYQVEEALANRDAWDWSKKKSVGLEDFSYDFMKRQPGAYARFDEDKFKLASELAANLIDLDVTRMARRDDQSLWVANIPEKLLSKRLCPEYVVRPVYYFPEIKAYLGMP